MEESKRQKDPDTNHENNVEFTIQEEINNCDACEAAEYRTWQESAKYADSPADCKLTQQRQKTKSNAMSKWSQMHAMKEEAIQKRLRRRQSKSVDAIKLAQHTKVTSKVTRWRKPIHKY